MADGGNETVLYGFDQLIAEVVRQHHLDQFRSDSDFFLNCVEAINGINASGKTSEPSVSAGLRSSDQLGSTAHPEGWTLRMSVFFFHRFTLFQIAYDGF